MAAPRQESLIRQLAKNLRGARERSDRTMEEIAEEMQVSVTAVKRWFSGKRGPSIGHLLELAHVLGMTADELLAGVTRRPSKDAELEELVARFTSAGPGKRAAMLAVVRVLDDLRDEG